MSLAAHRARRVLATLIIVCSLGVLGAGQTIDPVHVDLQAYFKAQVEPLYASATQFTFAAMGDIHVSQGTNHLLTKADWQTVLGRWRDAGHLFDIIVGDLGYGVTTDPTDVVSGWSAVPNARPVYYSMGNHEIDPPAGKRLWIDKLYPGAVHSGSWTPNTLQGNRDRAYWSYNVGPFWHFIMLDADITLSDGSEFQDTIGATQLAWLSQDLLANQARNVMVFVHEPIDQAKYDTPEYTLADRGPLMELLAAHPKQKFIFSGHLHGYRGITNWNGITSVHTSDTMGALSQGVTVSINGETANISWPGMTAADTVNYNQHPMYQVVSDGVVNTLRVGEDGGDYGQDRNQKMTVVSAQSGVTPTYGSSMLKASSITWYDKWFVSEQLVKILPGMTFSYDIYLAGVSGGKDAVVLQPSWANANGSQPAAVFDQNGLALSQHTKDSYWSTNYEDAPKLNGLASGRWYHRVIDLTPLAGSYADGVWLSAAAGSVSVSAAYVDNIMFTWPVPAPPTVATGAAASPSPVDGTTTSLSVLGADNGGEPNLTYTWTTTGVPPAAVAFSANGTNAAKNTVATFTKAGDYTFQVTIKDAGNLTVTSSVTVTVTQTLTSIGVTPANAFVAIGGTQLFTATARDQFGTALVSQPAITWSATDGGTISGTGLFTAGATPGGPFTVTATGGLSGAASVTVTPPNAAPTVATGAAATPNPVAGTTTALNVLGADDGGEANLTYTWATTGVPPAAVAFSVNGINAAKNTVATFAKAGSYTLQVTIRDASNLAVTSTVGVTVTPTPTSLTVSPATASVGIGGTQLFAATARDQFGAALAIQPPIAWAVSGGGTISTGGLFTPGTVVGGPWAVTATSGALVGAGNVTVTPAVSYVQGAASTNDASASSIAQALTTPATAGDLIVAAISWGSNDTVTCSDSQNNVYAMATTQFDSTNGQSLGICYAANVKAGATTVTAAFSNSPNYRRLAVHEYRGLALSAPVDVTAKNLANGTTAANAITSLAAITTVSGDLVFGAVMDDQAVTTITPGTGFTQRLSLNNKDLATEDLIQAASGSVAATHTFGAAHRYLALMVAFKPVVTGPPNAAPTVATGAAANPSPVAGTTTSLSALGADDGGEAALTYTWATTGTPPAAVAFSPNGTNAAKNTVATFTKAGSYTFQVTIKDAGSLTVTSTVGVTVAQTLTSVGVAPANASVGIGATQAFVATAVDQFGTALVSQPAITWSVSGGGTISAAGLFTAGNTTGGPFTVTAASGLNGTASVTVTAPNALPTVAIGAAASPSPASGTTTSLSVLGADDGGEASLSYTWATTGVPPAAVTFSANGTNAAKNTVATFTKAGDYTFQVTIKDAGNLTVTSSVTVTVAQTLTSIGVAPAAASVLTGATQLFTATARDQFGTAVVPQPAITWAVGGGGTLSASGLFTAGTLAGGPWAVTATSGAVIGTANVTVTLTPTIAYLQGAVSTNDASATSIAQALTTSTTAGDLIVAAISWGSNDTVTCSDSQSNVYAVATTQYDSTNKQSLGICYAANVKAGATTVTATFSNATNYRRLAVHEYRGLALSAPVDVTAKNLANGTTAANATTSLAAVTTASGDLIFGAVMDDQAVTTIAPGTGFTQRLSLNNKDLATEDLIQATAGSVAATHTFGAAHRYLALMVAFKHQ